MSETAPTPETPKRTRNEGLKAGNTVLGGTIVPTLNNATLDSFTPDDYEFLKFHGCYQQDDRNDSHPQYQHRHRMLLPQSESLAASALASLIEEQLQPKRFDALDYNL